jgi:hypothetical protein
MATCGICLRTPFLVAVPIDDVGGVRPPVGITRTDEDRRWLLEYLHESEGRCELVLPEWLLRNDPIGRLGLAQGSVVWAAPQWLLEAIAAASWRTAVPPRRRAAILARLPLIPTLRPFLRRFEGMPADQHQLTLL